MPCSVLLTDEKLPLPLGEYGRLLQEALGGIAYDHSARLKLRYGWLAQGLERPRAAALAARFAAVGVPVRVADEAAFVPVGELRTLAEAALEPQGLVHAGARENVPWKSVRMAAAGRIVAVREVTETETTRRVRFAPGKLLLGMPPVSARKETETVRTRKEDESIVLHLHCAAPAAVLVIHPERFDYQYLGARRAINSVANLALLLQDLRRFAGHAFWPRATRAWLDGGRLEPAFESEAAFGRCNFWLRQALAV